MARAVASVWPGVPGGILRTTLGAEPWGRIGSGIVELITSVLLLVPATASLGAVMALGVMAGAIFSHLTVLGPPPGQVFLMKLLAGRAPDHDDMIALWPTCGFADAQEAVAAYYAAYPFEEHDPHLVDYVQQIKELAVGGTS